MALLGPDSHQSSLLCGAEQPRGHRWLQPGVRVYVTCVSAPAPQIRFTRMGRKKLPFYRIVAVDSKVRRDGAPLEYLGWYDPLKKEANLNAPAIKKWLDGKGGGGGGGWVHGSQWVWEWGME